MGKIIYMFIFGMFLTGCVTMSPPAPEPKVPIEKTKVIAKLYEDVWKAGVQAFTSSGESVQVLDKANGLIEIKKEISFAEAKRVSVFPPFTDFQIPPELKVNVLFNKKDDLNTEVTINAVIAGRFYRVFSNFNVTQLNSNGTVEKEYFDKLMKLLP